MIRLCLYTACLLLSLSAAGADNEFAVCTLCHGTDVNGNIGVLAPKLAGQDRAYLLEQLQAFRSGARGTHLKDVSGSEMRTVALSLKERDLVRAVEFVTARPSVTPPAIVQGNAVRGRELYGACVACHGARAEGNAELHAPKLAAGSDWYWAIQLKNYRGGLRGSETASSYARAMRAAAEALPDEQAVNDVVAYMTTLK